MSAEEPLDLANVGVVPPTIESDDASVTPVYVKEVEWDLPSIKTSQTDLCGHSETDKSGTKNGNVTINGVVTLSQLNTLKTFNLQEDPVRVVSTGHTASVVFDEFTFTEKDSLNPGQFRHEGELLEEPLFSFQLQSEEEE